MGNVLLLYGMEDCHEDGDVAVRVTVEDCVPGNNCQGKPCGCPVSVVPQPDDSLVFLILCWGPADGGNHGMVI